MPTEFPIELPGIGTFYSDSEARLAYALTEMMLVRGLGAGGGGGGGDASAANQITEIARLTSILTELQGTLDVNIVSGGGGNSDATAANQLTEIARLTSILSELQGTIDVNTGLSLSGISTEATLSALNAKLLPGNTALGNALPVNVVAGGGAGGGDATAANQVTGNNSLASIDSKNPALISGRVPVILPASSGSNPLLLTGTIFPVTTTNTEILSGNFDTYSRLSFQLLGTWSGRINCQMSNNNSNWVTVPVANANTGEVFLDIESNGIYTCNASARYYRVLTSSVFSGSVNGNYISSTDDRSIDLIRPKFFSGSATALGVVLVGDCSNYHTISFSISGAYDASIALHYSNDGVFWTSGIPLRNAQTNQYAVDVALSTIYTADVSGKLFRIYCNNYISGTININGVLKFGSVFASSGGGGGGGDASAANQLTQIARLEALNNTCTTGTAISNSLTTTGSQVLGTNANRKGLIIFNPLSVDVFIGFFTGTTSSTYTYKLTPGEGIEVLYRYTGIVHALVSAGTGSIEITELI